MVRDRPKGLLRWFFKVPVWLYRAKLGFLFGGRFLMMEHRGRKSGLLHRTVVEVAGRPATKEGEWFVVSGFGPDADWYRNIREGNLVAIWLGSRRCRASVRFVEPPEAAAVMLDYETAHPKAAKFLAAELGLEHDGTPEGRLQLMRQVPMLAFSPDC